MHRNIQPDINSLFIKYLKNGEEAPPEIITSLKKLSKLMATILGSTLGDALGRAFEFSMFSYPPILDDNTPLNMFDEGGKFLRHHMKKGQGTDDCSQATCLIMAFMYALDFKKKWEEKEKNKGKVLDEEAFKNVLTNVFAHLLYHWWKDGLDTGFTIEQLKITNRDGSHSIGCGSGMSRFISFWDEIEKTHQSRFSEDFLLTHNTIDKFDKYYNQLLQDNPKDPELSKTDGNAATMRNGAPAFFAANMRIEDAMRYADHQSRTTTKGDEASACAQLQTFLTYKANQLNLSPKECIQQLFSKESFNEFITLFKKVNNDKEIPFYIKNLCNSTPTKRYKWLNWKLNPDEYGKTCKFDLMCYYGAYSTQGMALVFNAITYTNSYDDAMKMIVEAGGDADSNCAVAASMLGAIYGYEHIPERWLKLINRYPLNAGEKDGIPLSATTDLTKAVLAVATPTGISTTKVTIEHLASHALSLVMEKEYNLVMEYEKNKINEKHHYVKQVIEYNELSNYQNALAKLKDMDDEISNQYKSTLANKLLFDKKNNFLQIITEKSLHENKFKSKFINDLYKKNNIVIYEKLIQDDPSIAYLNINQLYESEYDKYIFLWKINFNGYNPQKFHRFKESGFVYKKDLAKHALIKYLSSIENDTSEEADRFKCQAFSYLYKKKWNGIDPLCKIVGCEQIITEPERKLIANYKINLLTPNAFVYQRILKFLLDPKIDPKIKSRKWNKEIDKTTAIKVAQCVISIESPEHESPVTVNHFNQEIQTDITKKNLPTTIEPHAANTEQTKTEPTYHSVNLTLSTQENPLKELYVDRIISRILYYSPEYSTGLQNEINYFNNHDNNFPSKKSEQEFENQKQNIISRIKIDNNNHEDIIKTIISISPEDCSIIATIEELKNRLEKTKLDKEIIFLVDSLFEISKEISQQHHHEHNAYKDFVAQKNPLYSQHETIKTIFLDWLNQFDSHQQAMIINLGQPITSTKNLNQYLENLQPLINAFENILVKNMEKVDIETLKQQLNDIEKNKVFQKFILASFNDSSNILKAKSLEANINTTEKTSSSTIFHSLNLEDITSLQTRGKKMGIPCFVSHELGEKIHYANALGKPVWEHINIEKINKIDKDFLDLFNHLKVNQLSDIQLLPIINSHSNYTSKRMQVDLDEIILFRENGGKISTTEDGQFNFIGRSNLNSFDIEKLQDTLNKEIINPKYVKKIRDFSNPPLSNLSLLCKQRLENVPDKEWERSLRAELHALKYNTVNFVGTKDDFTKIDAKDVRVPRTIFPVSWFNTTAKALKQELEKIKKREK